MIRFKKKELEEKLKLAMEFIRSAEEGKERMVYARAEKTDKDS